jgi:hypothetical protein
MGNDLVVREAHQMNVMTGAQLKVIAHTEFVPVGMRGKESAILACVLTGRALGIDDMTALRSIHIIDGKATFSAELMVQLVRRRGHSIVGNFSATSCTVTGKRADNGDEMTVTWTKEMAQEAGLLGKNNWKKYGASMLWARAVSQLSRMLFADCFAGSTYTEDEISEGEFVEEIGGESEGDGAAYGTHPGSVEPESASGTEPLPAESPSGEQSAGSAASGSDASPEVPSAAQIKKLNVLVGTLREAGKVTTEDVYRKLDDEGEDSWPRDEDGTLHWSPLRDSLTKAEAHTLIEWLTAVEAGPDPIPLAELVTLVNQHHVEHGAMTAAIERLFPGKRRASDLSDAQRGVLWADVQAVARVEA